MKFLEIGDAEAVKEKAREMRAPSEHRELNRHSNLKMWVRFERPNEYWWVD